MSLPGEQQPVGAPGGDETSQGPSQGATTGVHGAAPTGVLPGGQAAALAGEFSDRVIEAVAWLRARTTVRVLSALRVLVYGTVALVSLVTAAVLATLGIVRIWDAYVPVGPVARRVWLGYVVFGAVLFLPGAWLVAHKRTAKRG